jgi:hypothetical protein
MKVDLKGDGNIMCTEIELKNLLDFIQSEGHTVFDHAGGKYVILESSLDDNFLNLTIIPKKQFKRGNFEVSSNIKIDKRLISNITNTDYITDISNVNNDSFELLMLYGLRKLGLYRVIYWKEKL